MAKGIVGGKIRDADCNDVLGGDQSGTEARSEEDSPNTGNGVQLRSGRVVRIKVGRAQESDASLR